jgi:hypothetical protein
MTPEVNAIAASLLSAGPHPELLPEQQVFAPFIGKRPATAALWRSGLSWDRVACPATLLFLVLVC